MTKANANNNPLDAYGRDAAERTIELNQHIAEAISKWVDGEIDETAYASIKAEYEGGSEADTFEESHGYIMYRGLAEIKRALGAKELRKREKKAKQTQDLYAAMLKLNPANIADPKFVAKMLEDLGMVVKARTEPTGAPAPEVPKPTEETKAA